MRKTLDHLISWTGLILAVVLLVAGGLLTYASNFVSQSVEDQLSQQRITMPAADRLETQAQKDALLQYAGQQMTTGDQAKAFADQYILVHMNASRTADLRGGVGRVHAAGQGPQRQPRRGQGPR